MFKTPYLFKFLLLAVSIGSFVLSAKANPVDTIAKKNAPVANHNPYSLTESLEEFKDAVAAFKQDSLDKGLRLFAKFFREAEQSKHIMRMADYKGLQVYSFVKDADDGKLRPAEKKILGALFAEGVNQNVEGFAALKTEINNAPSTAFIAHLRLFMLYTSNEKQAEREAGKMLKDNPDDIVVNTL
jgi:hypothetical protein